MKVWILLENKHKMHLPETHRLSLYWQSLVSTRVLLLLLQICFQNGLLCFFTCLCFLPCTLFFSLRGSKHSISHTKLHKAFTLSIQSTSAPSLGVDLCRGATGPLPSSPPPTGLCHFPGTCLLKPCCSIPVQIWREGLMPLLLETPFFKQKKAVWFRDTRKKYLYQEYKTKLFSNILTVFIALSNPPARKSAIQYQLKTSSFCFLTF